MRPAATARVIADDEVRAGEAGKTGATYGRSQVQYRMVRATGPRDITIEAGLSTHVTRDLWNGSGFASQRRAGERTAAVGETPVLSEAG